MVATNEANYSQRYVDLAKEIVESLEFSEIEKLQSPMSGNKHSTIQN